MFFSTGTSKGHKNSNTLKRHGLRMKNKVSSCSKTLWIIGSIFVIILIAISSTVVHLGQDLIYADKQEKEALELKSHTDKYKNHPIDQRLNHYKKKDDIINKLNIDTSTEESNSSDNDDNEDNEDTERMDVNGKEVNIKKSEIEQVWKEVEHELDENEENNNKMDVLKSLVKKESNNISDSNNEDINENNNENDSENNNENDSENKNENIENKIENKNENIENKIEKNENDNDNNNENDSESHSDKTKENDKNDIEDNDEAKAFESDHKKSSDKITDNLLKINTAYDAKNTNKSDINMSDDKDNIDNENESDNIEIVSEHDNDTKSDENEAKNDNHDKSSDESDHKLEDNNTEKNDENVAKNNDVNKSSENKNQSEKTKLDSVELERVIYPEYWDLQTFFDIDKDDIEGLVKYWKQSGKTHYNKYITKFRELQDYDLKETIMIQDEHHNKKLQYIYDLNNDHEHGYNIDYDYLYPYMYPIEAYPKELLKPDTFYGNLTTFLQHDIGRPQSRYTPKWDIYEIYAANGDKYKRIISKQDMYNKHEKYLRNNYADIELIFPENDTLLFSMLNKFGERLKQHIMKEEKDSSETNHGGKFLRALKRIEDKDSSETDNKNKQNNNNEKKENNNDNAKRRLQKGFGLFDDRIIDYKNVDINDIGESTKEDVSRPRIHTFNGLTSDISYFWKNRSSIKYLHNFDLDSPMKIFMNGNMGFDDINEKDNDKLVMYKNPRFWRLHDHCVRRKSTSVYPNWRVLYASKPLTCDIILNELLDPISECLNAKGWKCPMLLDYGYFRFVFKSEAKAKYLYNNPINGEEMIPIVLKVMKTEFVDWTSDWLRHIREALFLQQVRQWEIEFIEKYGAQFYSLGQKRAFYYVPELGHCLYPTYITVTPFYNTSLKKFTRDLHTANMTLRKVTQMGLEILSGLQIMHNIQGGPFMHTDIQPRQFMIDDKGNVLINDFNRGKFMEYYFKNDIEGIDDKENDIIIPCTYCMPYSHGHYRAPEELYSDPLSEALDVWSICYAIWNLFSFEKPFVSIGSNYEAIKYLLHDYQMRPKFPYSVPPYLKDLLRQCWRPNMYSRPDINELMRSFRYFYKHLHRLSDGKQHLTLMELEKTKAYKETNFPDMEKIKEFV